MLTNEEKQRIREEEIFRVEVQKSLIQEKASQSLHKKVWSFLNTSLGIWVLSTIVIGLLGWSYAQWQLSKQNEEQVIKLDNEIIARFDVADSDLVFNMLHTDKPLYIGNVLLLPPREERMIHPEFASRSLKSLMYELQARVPIEEHNDVIFALSELQVIESDCLNKTFKGVQALQFQKRMNTIRDSRWKWDKILQRKMNARNQPFTVIGRFSSILLILPLLFLVYLLIKWYRQKNRKLLEQKLQQGLQSKPETFMKDSQQEVKEQIGSPS